MVGDNRTPTEPSTQRSAHKQTDPQAVTRPLDAPTPCGASAMQETHKAKARKTMSEPLPQVEMKIIRPYPSLDKYELHIYVATETARDKLKVHGKRFGQFSSRSGYFVLQVSRLYNHKEVERYLLDICTGYTVEVEPRRITEASTQSVRGRFISALVRIFPARKLND